MKYPTSKKRSEKPKLDKEAAMQKWSEYLLHDHEVRIGKRAKPPLVILKYHLDGTLTESPPM
jgi:hypothetical protein